MHWLIVHYKEQEGFINIKFWFNVVLTPPTGRASMRRITALPLEEATVCARAWGGMRVELSCGWIISSEIEKHTVDRPLSGTNKEEK